MKELAIVILDWNGAEDTIECLESLVDEGYHIYLLDNGSRKENVDRVIGYLKNSKYNSRYIFSDKVQLIEAEEKSLSYIANKENLGFALGNNYIVDAIVGEYEYVLLLNNDTVVPKGTIAHMLKCIRVHQVKALTCDIRSYYNRNMLWNAGGRFTVLGERKYYKQKKIDKLKRKGQDFLKAEFITGCALLILGEYIREYGLFTDKFFHGEEDFNFCYQMKKRGYEPGVDLEVVLYHKVGKAIGRRTSQDKENNKMVVHYSNRIIGFRMLYPYAYWKIWRIVYLATVFMLRIKDGMKIRISFELVRRIERFTKNNEQLKKTEFDRIMEAKW